MNEANKTIPSFIRNGEHKMLRGRGLDIGGGAGPFCPPWPCSIDVWDTPDGDAAELKGIEDGTYDFIIASHVLEHLNNVSRALSRWNAVITNRGVMAIMVPDFVLYEKRHWPSIYNPDHKQAFTLFDDPSIPEHVWTFRRFKAELAFHRLYISDVRLTIDSYDFSHVMEDIGDQTLGPACAQITYIIRQS